MPLMTRFVFIAFLFLLPMLGVVYSQESSGMQGRTAETPHRELPRYQFDFKPSDLPRANSPEARLMAKYCVQCHSLPSPTIHMGNEWDRALQRMFWRMDTLGNQKKSSWWPWSSGNALKVPTLEERELMTQYIKKNSLRRARAIPEPASPGAEVYKYTCSQCHVLPDTTLHSANEWPRTIEKMQKHLEGTILGPMLPEELDLILPYLQRNGRRFFGNS